MKCFNHAAADAVGVFKHCNKGLCRECAVEVAGSLSCRGACEAQVALVNRLMAVVFAVGGAFYFRSSREFRQE